MSSSPAIDGVLVQWGERLFYPGNRIVKSGAPRLGPFTSRADAIRSRIESTVRRAPQVMVKVTGGGRGMKAIAAHLRYISKNGQLKIEDDRGVVEQGRDVLRDIERQWRYGGAYIDDIASGASMRRRHGKPFAAPFATTRISGARRLPRRAGSVSRDRSARLARPPLQIVGMLGRPGRPLLQRWVPPLIRRTRGSRWTSSTS